MARHFTRRRFLALAGGGAAMLAGASAYARFIEPEWLEVLHVAVPLKSGPEPLKLLHLSDLHFGESVRIQYVREAFERGAALQPDLICLTGDIINAEAGDADRFVEALSFLPRIAPTFASLGNHDGGRWAARWGGYADTKVIRKMLGGAGIEHLDNRARAVEIRGRQLHLVGLGDSWAGEFLPQRAFEKLQATPQTPVIVLSHNPDTKDLSYRYRWNLMLSGHTHGGQFYLPGIGRPFLPVADKRFVMGLHRWQDRWLHITKGIGNMHGLRFNCRPDLTLLTLT